MRLAYASAVLAVTFGINTATKVENVGDRDLKIKTAKSPKKAKGPKKGKISKSEGTAAPTPTPDVCQIESDQQTCAYDGACSLRDGTGYVPGVGFPNLDVTCCKKQGVESEDEEIEATEFCLAGGGISAVYDPVGDYPKTIYCCPGQGPQGGCDMLDDVNCNGPYASGPAACAANGDWTVTTSLIDGPPSTFCCLDATTPADFMANRYNAANRGNWFWNGAGTRPEVVCLSDNQDPGATQPLPNGAVRLDTTTNSNSILQLYTETVGSLGCNAASVIPSIQLEYSFYMAQAADYGSVNLRLYMQNYGGNNWGATFVYEPQYNDNDGGGPVAANVWKTETITNTQGYFWKTCQSDLGGTDCGNTPGMVSSSNQLKTLQEWLDADGTANGIDGMQATTSIQWIDIGENSGTTNQISYFDQVRWKHNCGTGIDVTYNFETTMVDFQPAQTSNA